MGNEEDYENNNCPAGVLEKNYNYSFNGYRVTS